jgi:hypothetical protein
MLQEIFDIFPNFASSFAGIHIAMNKVCQRLSFWRWSMTATMDDYDREIELEETENECHAEAAEESAIVDAHSEEPTSHGTLPWIGALPNPRIGPMVVINDGGYLVPL